MDLEKTVIDNIKRIRKENHITQEQLAEACTTATSYIGLMETYKNVPKLSTIEKIAAALNVEPEILFKKSEGEKKDEQKIRIITDTVIESMRKELYRAIRENWRAE